MSDAPIIEVRGLSKAYTIGHQLARNATLRDSLAGAARRPLSAFRRTGFSREQLWALDDVTFDVQRGDVVGIVGRNGSGKSTLLKVLSRIVVPTRGEAVLRGRAASLLEVGTGFHPELTGRENVFLNGAILGMPRREIVRKFDEIAAFAEVERFLDTPVKFYSSGMYVRLAFAVAAHLEPDILIVDEVLAVGDAAFQRKSLGKMSAVAKEGRTVLFVSHNANTVLRLCDHGLYLHGGKLKYAGTASGAVEAYQGELDDTAEDLPSRGLVSGTGGARITAVSVVRAEGDAATGFDEGDPLVLEMEVELDPDVVAGRPLVPAFGVDTDDGYRVFTCVSSWVGDEFDVSARTATYRCVVERSPLAAGRYYVSAAVTRDRLTLDHAERVRSFQVLPRRELVDPPRDPSHGAVEVAYRFEEVERPAVARTGAEL